MGEINTIAIDEKKYQKDEMRVDFFPLAHRDSLLSCLYYADDMLLNVHSSLKNLYLIYICYFITIYVKKGFIYLFFID